MSISKGYIERNKGSYVGELIIDGVDISPISALFFRDNGTHWLWIKRKPILDYSFEQSCYLTKSPKPQFEVYLTKTSNSKQGIAYKGTFVFFRFKYTIVGIWDDAHKDTDRLNLLIERLPMDKQDIIQRINEIKQKHEL